MVATWKTRCMQGFMQTAVTPLLRKWPIVVGVGVAIAAVGVLLLVDLAAAAKSLAILVAIGLFITGIDEIVQAERHRVRWPSWVLGAAWIITGVVALAWPGITLWALAAVVGVGLVIGGVAEFVFAVAYRRELPMWGLWMVDAVLSVLVGSMALSWPGVTVLALAILLGVRVLLRGISTITFGWSLRQLARTAEKTYA